MFTQPHVQRVANGYSTPRSFQAGYQLDDVHVAHHNIETVHIYGIEYAIYRKSKTHRADLQPATVYG